MNILSDISLEEVEFNIKKKGLWEVVITDNVSYRDLFNIIKELCSKNTKLQNDVEKLNNEIYFKDEMLKKAGEIRYSNFFINVIKKEDDN